MHNQQLLNNYFNKKWNGRIDQYMYSGIQLINKISPTETVLDVGCGTNPFKSLIPNLIGIDPAFDQADIKCTIEDFVPSHQFDVAFCLGSINFGTEETILHQIQCVVNALKPSARIYWRCNPGRKDHGNTECEQIDFFEWSPSILRKYAAQFGFIVADMQQDNNNRIYCEWTR